MISLLLIVCDGSHGFLTCYHLTCIIHILDGATSYIFTASKNTTCINRSTHRTPVKYIHYIDISFFF